MDVLEKRLFPLFLFTVTLCFLVGCGGPRRPPDLPKLYPCQVLVTYDDQTPIDNAFLSLYAEDPELRWSVTGTTDVSGKAVLTTHGRFRGAPAGRYKMTVNRREVEEGGTKQSKVFTYVEKKFTNRKTTPLEVEISKETKTLNFQCGPKIDKTYLMTISNE